MNSNSHKSTGKAGFPRISARALVCAVLFGVFGVGEIVIRAETAGNSGVWDEKKFTIRAVPTSVTNSIIFTSETYEKSFYGAGWVHYFDSTGGSLAGIKIRETVETKTNNPFGWNYKVTLEDGVEWTLNANGRMDSADGYFTGKNGIDATKFTTFPQTAVDIQNYYWECPVCPDWVHFSGPNEIAVTLDKLSNGKFIVITSAYGKSHTNDYTGRFP